MINDLLAQIPEGIYQFVARVALVFLALVLIIILRRILTWLILRPLRQLSKRSGYDTDDQVVELLIAPMRLLVIAVAIAISVQIIQTTEGINVLAFGIARTLILLALFLFVYRLVDLIAPSSLRIANITGFSIQERLIPFIRVGAKLLIISVAIVVVLQEWGYDVSGLLAGIGIGGLALSLAAQDTLANLFGFMAIVSDRPFDVGEFIKVNDVEGTVEHVGLRSTRLRQLNQAVVYMPNNFVANSAILNWSRLKKRFLDLRIGVEYETTNDQLQQMMAQTRAYLKSQEKVDANSVVVHVIDFRTESIDIIIRCYVYLTEWAPFTAEKEKYTLATLDIMKDLKIELAESITDIRMVEEDRPSRIARKLSEDDLND